MKKTLSEAGLFNVRAILGLALCALGLCIGIEAVARTTSVRTHRATSLKPTVVVGSAHAVTPSVRDLAPMAPMARTFEHELPPVKAARPVPKNFVDAVVQTSMAPLKTGARSTAAATAAMPSPIASFDGVSALDGCLLCVPPDTTGAVGPSQYVQMVNTSFAVYTKTGTRLTGPTAINQLFQSLPADDVCRTSNLGDPVVIYDQLADRWLLSQFGFNLDANNNPAAPFHECVAVSQGPDATGPYYVYSFHLSDTTFHDYPHLGLWPDGYYMTTHEFDGTSLNYVGAGVFAFERDKMLAGQDARFVYFDLGTLPAPYNTGFGGHLPSNLDGFTLPPQGAPNYIAEVDATNDIGTNAAAMRIWKFHVDWSNPANSTFGNAIQPNSVLPVANFARPACSIGGERVYVAGCVPQLGDASQLDPIGDRLMYRMVYRNFGDHESLILNHTVVSNSVAGQATQFGPRWYEVRDPGGNPTVYQQSTFGPTGGTDLLYRFIGSVAMDRAGDIALAYSTSSSASFPSIAYAGRLAGDPLNTLTQTETQLIAGGGAQHAEWAAPQTGRWGDYSTMTVDPVDDCTFWYTNEYYPTDDPGAATANWHTRIGSFKLSQCTPRPVGFLRGTVTDTAGAPISGARVTAGGYTAFTDDNGFYQFSPLGVGSYTDAVSAIGYFPSSTNGVAVTDGGVTVQNFTLTRDQAVPTPPPAPRILQTVNPPVLSDPGTTVTTNSYTLNWTAAEVTAGLSGYVIEESTDYVNPLFDNADGTSLPGQAGSAWNTDDDTGDTAGWIQNPAYHSSAPNSYEGPAPGPAPIQFDPSLTLKNNITIPATAGSARLTFYSRYFNGPDDTGNVEVSTDSGATWSALKVLTDSPLPPPADTRMQNYEVDLTAYKGKPIKLRFRFNGGSSVNFIILSVGWWLDDINVDAGTWHQVGTAGPGSTSLTLFNKPSGHYYYRVRGVYSNGTRTTNSNVQDIIVNAPTVLPTAAASRKMHNGAPFDVDLPLSGGGIEPRTGGANGDYQVVVKFPSVVTFGSVTSTCGSVSSTNQSGNDLVVNLTGVASASRCAVNVNGINGGGNASVPVNFLTGDTTGDGFVNSADISQTKSQSGQILTTSNCREDLTVDGNINSADIAFVKSKSGTALPDQ